MATPRQTPTLQKMEIADLLDAAIRLYRHNFLPILEIVALVYGPLTVIQVIFSWLIFSLVSGAGGEEVPWGAFLGLIPLILVGLAAWTVLLPLGEGALAVAVSEIYLGRQISPLNAYRRIWPLWWRLLLTMILVSLATVAGGVFCLVPGLVLWTWFIAATPIVVIERLWGPQALSRSYNLVTGHGWRVFGTWFLLSLMVFVVLFALVLPADLLVQRWLLQTHPLLAQTLVQAFSGVLQIVLQPIAMIGTVLIYYDLRIRKEGFDLVTMAQELQRQAPGQPQVATEPLFTSDVPLPPRPSEGSGELPPRPPEGRTDQS